MRRPTAGIDRTLSGIGTVTASATALPRSICIVVPFALSAASTYAIAIG